MLPILFMDNMKLRYQGSVGEVQTLEKEVERLIGYYEITGDGGILVTKDTLNAKRTPYHHRACVFLDPLDNESRIDSIRLKPDVSSRGIKNRALGATPKGIILELGNSLYSISYHYHHNR